MSDLISAEDFAERWSVQKDDDIKFIGGNDTRILLIAPHGVMGDDDNTDVIALEVQERLDCFAIVNDVFQRDDQDFNSAEAAAKHSLFIPKIREVIESDGHTLVVWIHGVLDANVKKEAKIKASGFSEDPSKLHGLIGYGQGQDPSIPEKQRKPEDKRMRPTINRTTVEALLVQLMTNGMTCIFTRDNAPKYRGRAADNMNQWFRNEGYGFEKVESVQLEIRCTGFRDYDGVLNSVESITAALTVLVPPQVQATKEPESQTTKDAEVLDDDEPTPFDGPDIKNLQLKPESDVAAETSNLPIKAGTAPEVPTRTDEEIAEQAYKWLVAKYKEKVVEFSLEVGDYIIKTFFNGDPSLAVAKIKGSDRPKSLRLLIKKFRSGSPSKTAPSERWFYRAVGLAAQMALAKEMNLPALAKLGHAHRIELLHYPKIRDIKDDDSDNAIESAFREKEELAQHAIKAGLSSRKFGKYIKEQENRLSLKDLPSKAKLLKHDPDELIRLYEQAQASMEKSQKAAVGYGKAKNRLNAAIAELTGGAKGDGRFQDWTKSKNNFNICTGCPNDCLYCYMKSIFDGNPKRKQPHEWATFELRQAEVEKNRGLRDGLVGFPSSHDIFPEILDAYLEVLGKFLRAGNEVLIVSKPRLDCIKAICAASTFFKDKILFRFTIGAMDQEILSFWEPNAPTYEERKECLKYACENGFRTSVSIEPMLDTANIKALVADLEPLVTEDIWLGMMSHLEGGKTIKNWGDKEGFENRKLNIEKGQTPSVLAAIYDTYQVHTKIKWKTETLRVITDYWKTSENKGKIVANIAPKMPKFKGWDKAAITTDSGKTKNVAAPVIISATRRSDIPACFADEFMESLRRGHAQYLHRGKWINVSFANTRFIVFWTKNPSPLIPHLPEIDRMGIGYYFLYTLNDYDQEGLEPGMPALQERIDTFKGLSNLIGKERVVWRFDPLILADKISEQALIDKIGSVMGQLAGYTEKLVFSFLDPDKYNARNKLKNAGYEALLFSDKNRAFIAREIAKNAEKHGIQIAACANPTSLEEYGVLANKCIDDKLIGQTFSQDADLMTFLKSVEGIEHKGQRDYCHCTPAYDIGSDNTCRNGCVYCYANISEKAVKANRERIMGHGEIQVP